MRETPTRRASDGMVASVDHRASGAGVAMLVAGGSAADAAVAASAVLAVTAPHLCGMGGDLFALVADPASDGGPVALNASGRAGAGADPGALRDEGHDAMPFRFDVRTVTTPGCVDGWLELHGRYGRLPLEEVLEPARLLAEEGAKASPLLAEAASLLGPLPGAGDLVGTGRLEAGSPVRRPGVARALRAVARQGRAGFYQGEFGQGLLELGRGYLVPADLERGNASWVAPLSLRLGDHVVWTTPPNSQGYLTLLGLAIADGLPLPADPGEGSWAHLLVEAARSAGHDRPSLLHEGADVRPLLEPAAVAARRSLVDPARRSRVRTLTGPGGTMHLAAVDRQRLGVSLIQSNAAGFGSHLFEGRTGINLHNRGMGFSLEPGHPAEFGPGRRPPHTLSPALVTGADGTLRAVVGTMGGDSQPQILLQLLVRLLRHGEPPGRVIGAPRWVLGGPAATGFHTWAEPDEVVVEVEPHAPGDWSVGLARRGHVVRTVATEATFGHAQLIEVEGAGLAGAADPRAGIGAASGY